MYHINVKDFFRICLLRIFYPYFRIFYPYFEFRVALWEQDPGSAKSLRRIRHYTRRWPRAKLLFRAGFRVCGSHSDTYVVKLKLKNENYVLLDKLIT